MAMTPRLAAALCAQNAQTLEEVMGLIDAGELKIILRGEDITDVERARIRTNLGRMLQIMDAFGGDHP